MKMLNVRIHDCFPIRLPAAAIVVACLVMGHPLKAQTPTLSDCREIENARARFECYEAIEVPGQETADAAAPDVTQDIPAAGSPGVAGSPQAPDATQDIPAADAPEVTGRAQAPDVTQDIPAADSPGEAGTPQASVEEEKAPQEQEKSFLKRLWPFGGDKDEKDNESGAGVEDEQVATTPGQLESFGRAGNDARVVEKENGKKELHDRIARLEQLGANQWLITLESGQTWRQMISKRYRLEVGDEVRIYPTLWGSDYRLTAERLQSYIQVTRVE